jgi:hypothetical protein
VGHVPAQIVQHATRDSSIHTGPAPQTTTAADAIATIIQRAPLAAAGCCVARWRWRRCWLLLLLLPAAGEGEPEGVQIGQHELGVVIQPGWVRMSVVWQPVVTRQA